MELKSLLEAMHAAEIAKTELENAMLKFDAAMTEMNRVLAAARTGRPNINLVASR